jgi:ribonucleotide reductase beta subunit family protein with ferritin-like domain
MIILFQETKKAEGDFMFFSLFSSKDKRLVKKWKKEHEQIVVLAHKVIAEYSKNNPEGAKKELKALNDIAVDHLMDEDIEFYRRLKDSGKLDSLTEKLIKEFVATFKGTKMALMDFLTKYTRPEAVLDDEFFKKFNELVEVLGERIAFEEENLYSILEKR